MVSDRWVGKYAHPVGVVALREYLPNQVSQIVYY